MNKKTLITLEYNKIISALVSMACSDGARQTLKALVPMNNIDDINAALDETNDALTRVYQKGLTLLSFLTSACFLSVLLMLKTIMKQEMILSSL